jgi:ATP-binding cassette, subfamily B, bacterial
VTFPCGDSPPGPRPLDELHGGGEPFPVRRRTLLVVAAPAAAGFPTDEAPAIDFPGATLSAAEPRRPPAGAGDLAWFSIATDVALGGEPVGEWLVASPVGLAVAEREVARGERPAAGGASREIHWGEIDRIRTAAGIGGGMLQVRVGGDWVDFVRYSNALAGRFHKLARALEIARETAAEAGGPVAEPEFDRGTLDPPHCSDCSLRLPTADDACPRCLQKGRIVRRVADLVAPHARGATALVVLTILGVAAELVPPKLQQYLVDDILSAGNAGGPAAGDALPDFRTALLVVVLALAASRVLLSVVAVFKGRLASVIGSSLTAGLRQEMVDKLQSLSVAYYDRHQVASMISRVAHDSEVLHGLVQQFTGGFLLQIVQLVAVGAMLFWINPTLAACTLIPVPLVILGSWIFWRHVYPRHYRLWDASSKQMAVLSGMLSGIRVVKAFGQEPGERDRFRSASEHLRGWRQWVDLTGSTYSAAMQIVFSLGGLIVWYVGGRDVLGQKMSLGQLIAFLAYLAMFYAPLGALSSFTTWLTSFLSGSKRVLELLDTPALIPEPAEPVAWEEPRGQIAFRDVTFGYDEHQPVLHDVSFAVAPGEMIGIVGRSGSGKSTLVNLLARFHDVQQGRIEIDGIDIRRLPTRLLRERLGIVFQESFLFRGTIWKNLAYGRPAATIEEGLAAAKAAGAHDFLCRQPAAYETLLGERGAGLSGGEKQRLSIARTLLADPAVLVLDEATSSIDAEAEREIQRALAALIQGRTTIAIAHRLSTLRNADRIMAFDRGRLVEEGTHAELLAADGLYARLVRIQTQVSRQPTVDALLAGPPEPAANGSPVDAVAETNGCAAATAASGDGSGNGGDDEPAESQARIRWLDPERHRFVRGDHGRIELWQGPERLAAGVFVVATFPATRPEEYLSVRGWDDDGEERELGMIRQLADWPAAARGIVGDAVARRTLVRSIRRIHDLRLARGYLDFDVETDAGRRTFTTRWTQSQAVDFGSNGKLLIDTEDNRWVVPDVGDLPKADREKFERFVYW